MINISICVHSNKLIGGISFAPFISHYATTRRRMPGRRKLLIVCFYSQMCLRGTCTHRVAPTQGRKKWANIRTRSARGSDICWMQLPRVGWLSKVARLPAFYDKLPDSSDCFCHFYPLKGTAGQRCWDHRVQIMPFQI